MKNTRKTKKNKNRKTLKGGKCKIPLLNGELKDFRDRLINLWGKTGWKLKPKIKKITLKKEEEEYHHPVIINLLYQNNKYQLEKDNDIWCLYYGKSKFGRPEYDFAMDIINNFCESSRSCETNDICYLIPEIMKELYKTTPFNNVNILQPSLWQIFVLQYFIEKGRYKLMNDLQNVNTSTHELWKIYLLLFYIKDTTNTYFFIDLDLLGSGHDDDLDERADIIVNRIIHNDNIKNLYTMDGHGRLITRIVVKLQIESPDFFINNPDFNIFVYEIDDEVHMWHRITLPNGSAIKGNIIDELDKSIQDGSIEEKLFYCNFSGLSGQGARIINCYNLLYESDDTDNIDNVIVSFSSVREGKKSADNLLKGIIDLNETKLLDINKRIVLLTERNDFYTIGTYD